MTTTETKVHGWPPSQLTTYRQGFHAEDGHNKSSLAAYTSDRAPLVHELADLRAEMLRLSSPDPGSDRCGRAAVPSYGHLAPVAAGDSMVGPQQEIAYLRAALAEREEQLSGALQAVHYFHRCNAALESQMEQLQTEYGHAEMQLAEAAGVTRDVRRLLPQVVVAGLRGAEAQGPRKDDPETARGGGAGRVASPCAGADAGAERSTPKFELGSSATDLSLAEVRAEKDGPEAEETKLLKSFGSIDQIELLERQMFSIAHANALLEEEIRESPGKSRKGREDLLLEEEHLQQQQEQQEQQQQQQQQRGGGGGGVSPRGAKAPLVETKAGDHRAADALSSSMRKRQSPRSRSLEVPPVISVTAPSTPKHCTPSTPQRPAAEAVQGLQVAAVGPPIAQVLGGQFPGAPGRWVPVPLGRRQSALEPGRAARVVMKQSTPTSARVMGHYNPMAGPGSPPRAPTMRREGRSWTSLAAAFQSPPVPVSPSHQKAPGAGYPVDPRALGGRAPIKFERPLPPRASLPR